MNDSLMHCEEREKSARLKNVSHLKRREREANALKPSFKQAQTEKNVQSWVLNRLKSAADRFKLFIDENNEVLLRVQTGSLQLNSVCYTDKD